MVIRVVHTAVVVVNDKHHDKFLSVDDKANCSAVDSEFPRAISTAGESAGSAPPLTEDYL